MMDALRLVTHNVYVGQSPASVKENLTKVADITLADVIATQESKRFKGTIPGFERFSAPSHGDNANCVWHVSKNILFLEERLITTGGGSYRGPHGDLRDEKIYPGIIVSKGGLLYRLLDIHISTGPVGVEDNRSAEFKAIRDWMDESRGVASGAFGDWNTSRARVAAFAKTFDGKSSTLRVDGGAYKNMRIVRKRTLKSRHGSDGHFPTLFVLSA